MELREASNELFLHMYAGQFRESITRHAKVLVAERCTALQALTWLEASHEQQFIEALRIAEQVSGKREPNAAEACEAKCCSEVGGKPQPSPQEARAKVISLAEAVREAACRSKAEACAEQEEGECWRGGTSDAC